MRGPHWTAYVVLVAAEAGLLGEPRHDGSGCTVVWPKDETHELTADVRPGVGLVTISVSGIDVVTPEGVGTGSPRAEVYARYPDVRGDQSKVAATVPGRPEAAYWFWLDRYDGVVDGVMLLLTDDRCYS